MTRPTFQNWCSLPTPMGEFRMYDVGDESVHLVCFGDVREQGTRPLVRVHSSCLASEVFAARDCDCADQLREAMKLIANEGRGLIIHLHQEGRGQGLANKIQAVGAMQRDGLDTVEAFESLGLEQDVRSYSAAVQILRALGLDEVRLISNNPAKARFLGAGGIGVELVSTHPIIRPENLEYLRTKQAKLDHRFVLDDGDVSTGDVRFYHSDQPWGELANFSPHAVFIRGRIWPTTEHFYQAQKFAGTEREEQIRCSGTPTLAKLLAQEWKALRRPGWVEVKEEIMLEGLRAKFGQHPDLRERLLATEERQLVEHTEHDAYWGDAGDGTGRNRLGALLMRVRAELRDENAN